MVVGKGGGGELPALATPFSGGLRFGLRDSPSTLRPPYENYLPTFFKYYTRNDNTVFIFEMWF
jgi:hypothetical protein